MVAAGEGPGEVATSVSENGDGSVTVRQAAHPRCWCQTCKSPSISCQRHAGESRALTATQLR